MQRARAWMALRVAAPDPILWPRGSGTARVTVEAEIRPIRLARSSCQLYNWACSGLAAVSTMASHVGTRHGSRTDNLRWYHDFRRRDAKSSFCFTLHHLLPLSISQHSVSAAKTTNQAKLTLILGRHFHDKITAAVVNWWEKINVNCKLMRKGQKRSMNKN